MIWLNKLILTATISLFLLLPIAIADVNVMLSTNDMVGYTGETPSIDVTVKNNGTSKDTFSVSVWPPQFAGVTTSMDKYIVTVAPDSGETVKLYFSIAMDAEEVTPIFSISAKSTTNENVSDIETLYLRIVRKTNVYIKDIKLEKYTLNPEEAATIETSVINIADTPSGKYYLETTIKKANSIVKKFDDTLEGIAPRSTVKVSKSYTFEKYASPGSYAVESVLKDSANKIVSLKGTNLNIESTYKIPREYSTKSTKYTFVMIVTTLTVKNEGNVPTPSFYITESIPSIVKSLFDPEIEPDTATQTDGRTVYSWLVPTLDPGKQITIKYNFGLWRIWLAAIIVGVAIYGGFTIFYKPSVVKRYRHEGAITREKEILISLDVRNRTKHEMRDVEVRDFVPSIARVVEKFDTLAPRTRTSEVGTELRWKIDSLKVGEERVLTYRIRPVVEVVGSLNLPEAKVRYADRKKVKRIIASKAVMIKG